MQHASNSSCLQPCESNGWRAQYAYLHFFTLLSSTCCYKYFLHICFFQRFFNLASPNPYFWSSSLSPAASVSTPPSFHECSSHRFPYSSSELKAKIRGSERLYIPREPKSIQLTVVTGNQTLFTERGTMVSAACACGSTPSKADFSHFCHGCGVLL